MLFWFTFLPWDNPLVNPWATNDITGVSVLFGS